MTGIAKHLLVALCAALVLAACGDGGDSGSTDDGTDAGTEQSADDGGSTGMANPASAHCEENGGSIETREDADGGQYGVCVFEDGSECEEWAYFREECEPGGDPA